MKKLARKLSIFALSSVMLLSNPPIKAGMFAEGQTYDLGEVGTVNIRNHGINNDGSVEAFDVHIENSKLDIDVYRENDGIAYVLRDTGNVVSSNTIEHCKDFRNAEYVLKILIERITGNNLPTFPRLIPSTPECSMTTIETSAMDKTQKTPKHTKQRQEKQDKFVEEKKPKKVNPTKHRKITYKLPKGVKYDYEHGHCACEQPEPGKLCRMTTKIDGNPVKLHFYPCLKCLRPIRKAHAINKSCCW